MTTMKSKSGKIDELGLNCFDGKRKRKNNTETIP